MAAFGACVHADLHPAAAGPRPGDHLGDLGRLLRHHPAAAGRFRRRLHRQPLRLRLRGRASRRRRRCASNTASTSRSGCSTEVDRQGRGRRFRHVDGMGPAGDRGDRRPALAHHRRSRSAAIILTWGIALPIGIYSAVRQYSFADYIFTFVGFVGLAVPNFLLALIIMYFGFTLFDMNVGGLFSAEYQLAPWSWGKVWDLIVAPAAAGADPGARRHRAADPHHARQPARRAAPALCHDRARARARRSGG